MLRTPQVLSWDAGDPAGGKVLGETRLEKELERAECTEPGSGIIQMPAGHPAQEQHRPGALPSGAAGAGPRPSALRLPGDGNWKVKAEPIGTGFRSPAARASPPRHGKSLSSGSGCGKARPGSPEHVSRAIARPEVAVTGAAGLAPTRRDAGAFFTPGGMARGTRVFFRKVVRAVLRKVVYG